MQDNGGEPFAAIQNQEIVSRERRQFLKLGGIAATAGLVKPPFLPGGEHQAPPDTNSGTINEMFDFEEMEKISAYAREHNIKLHLDGARLFNVPQHSGTGIEEYTALFGSAIKRALSS